MILATLIERESGLAACAPYASPLRQSMQQENARREARAQASVRVLQCSGSERLVIRPVATPTARASKSIQLPQRRLDPSARGQRSCRRSPLGRRSAAFDCRAEESSPQSQAQARVLALYSTVLGATRPLQAPQRMRTMIARLHRRAQLGCCCWPSLPACVAWPVHRMREGG